MKKTIQIILSTVCMLSANKLFAYSLTFEPGGDALPLMSDNVNLGSADPITVVYSIFSILLTLLGLAFLILIIYAGFKWMLARGEEEEITKAKDILKRGIIGLGIILMSYSIAYMVYEVLRLTVMSVPAQN